MYQSGDMLAHFKGVSVFLEVVEQHAAREKEEAVYCSCKVCNNNIVQSGFMDNYFIWSKQGETQPRIESIIDEREEENMNADHVYSHHDDGGDDNAGENDEGLGAEELRRNVAPNVLLQYRIKGFDNFGTHDKVSRDILYEESKGCLKEHMVLWITLELLKLKASNGWSDNSVSALLELSSKVLPQPNSLPSSTYLAKKITCLLTLGVEKNHAFPSH
jgi:hypothetical protein